MREITFRAQYLHSNEWVYGVPFTSQKRTYMLTENERIRELWGVINDTTYFQEAVQRQRVKLSTMGQYTGLEDKNGVKIFEGDIVSAPNCFYDAYAVEWDARLSSFVVRAPVMGSVRLLADCVDVKVLGNIHDNPEMLEV